MLSGFDSSSTARYEPNTHTHTLLTHANYQSKFTAEKNGIQGHFENSRWNVNHRMMKGLQKYPLQKEKKRSSERRSNVSSLFPAWLAPCKLYADAFPLRHQTKSEMQVEFYVSDIQEVRRICSAIPLATFPPPPSARRATCKQHCCARHETTSLSRSASLSAFSLSSSRSFLLSHM